MLGKMTDLHPVHVNESGLPLNAVEWLKTHHRSKTSEREQMVLDLQLRRESWVIDAGCGPGLWTPLLAKAIGPTGRITGVDSSPAALATARSRLHGKWYASLVEYKAGTLERLPVPPSSVDAIFSANVSQYLPDPAETFASMARFLAPGGLLAIKDIDFGTIRFPTIDQTLQSRVYQARERWERARVDEGLAFEDSWVGSKLAGYVRAAGYVDVVERSYRIVRHYPLSPPVRHYLRGIAEWFVGEGAPFLAHPDCQQWNEHFLDGVRCALDTHDFCYEETEYMVTGIWCGFNRVEMCAWP